VSPPEASPASPASPTRRKRLRRCGLRLGSSTRFYAREAGDARAVDIREASAPHCTMSGRASRPAPLAAPGRRSLRWPGGGVGEGRAGLRVIAFTMFSACAGLVGRVCRCLSSTEPSKAVL
jgi:hypothetical protein